MSKVNRSGAFLLKGDFFVEAVFEAGGEVMIWADDAEEAEVFAGETIGFVGLEVVGEEVEFGDFVFVEVDEPGGFVFETEEFFGGFAAVGEFLGELFDAGLVLEGVLEAEIAQLSGGDGSLESLDHGGVG
jgi:hypothetical protein